MMTQNKLKVKAAIVRSILQSIPVFGFVLVEFLITSGAILVSERNWIEREWNWIGMERNWIEVKRNWFGKKH